MAERRNSVADNSYTGYSEELDKIYEDTNYFIDAITAEYGFYDAFIDAMRDGDASVSVSRRTISKTVEDQWISAIEACLPTIDYLTRNYSVGIEEREEVLPIELSKRVNNRSVRHLAQHTDFIKDVTDGEVTPSRILNVFNEETVLTYENKFINTLIQRLFVFIDKRCVALAGGRANETGTTMAFDSSFRFGSAEGKLSLKIEVTDTGAEDGQDDAFTRMEKLRGTVARYLDSPFVKMMENNYIRPPVMRTNAILKNKYLRECLDLWDYIESYEKLGYIIETEEQAEKPSDKFIREVYSLMSLQYLMFDYNLHKGAADTPHTVTHKRSEKPISPRLVTHFQKVEAKDYNTYETEYRRVVNITDASAGRSPAKGETEIRLAIEAALDAERELTAFRKQSKSRK